MGVLSIEGLGCAEPSGCIIQLVGAGRVHHHTRERRWEQHGKIPALLALVLVVLGSRVHVGPFATPSPLLCSNPWHHPQWCHSGSLLDLGCTVAASLLGLSVSDDLPVFSGYLERVSAGAMGDLNAELLHVAEVA